MSHPVTEEDIPALMAAGMLQLERGDVDPDPSPLISALTLIFTNAVTGAQINRHYRILAKLFGHSITVMVRYVGPNLEGSAGTNFDTTDDDRAFPCRPPVRAEHEKNARRALARDINKALPTLPRHIQMALYAALQARKTTSSEA